MSKFLICLQLMITVGGMAFSQSNKTTTHVNQIWSGYFNQTRFSDKWGSWTDIQVRTNEKFVKDFSTAFIRLGLTYYVNTNTKLTAGYAYVNNFPADAHKKTSQPEHRPWQQVQWHTKYGKKNMMQWFRLDERFRRKILNDSTLDNGYNFNFRIRYNIWYDVPLSRKGIVPNSMSFVLNNEVLINFGKQVVNNYFDQNRFFAGFKYQLTERNNLQFGYSNVFIQTPAGNRYRSLHTARLFYFHNLDLRDKTP